MPITNDSLNKDLYRLLKVRGFDPVPKDSEGETTPVPDEADVFKFTFKRHDKPYGTAWVTVDSNQQLVVYYKDEINNVGELDEDESSAGYDDSWTGFLKNLKNWAQRRQLGFDLENQDHLASDMAQRTHMKKKEQIAEGYYPMGNKASYSDAIPTIKIVLQHTRQIQEGEQRYRNVARIFLENTHGERILAPTTKPGIAQIYARHLAEGGVPNDDRWNHIKSLCEEYGKMAGFVRAVRGNQFNESAQRLVEAGLNHYQNLRESLGKMRGHRGYNAYFESWTPTLMETEGDESNLNELFVQETLDPRIESVMPILSKLKLNLGEMKEVNELAEWADNVTEQENRAALNPVGIPESDDLMEKMDPDKKARLDDLIDQFRDATDPSDYGNDYNDPEDAIALIRAEFGDKIADQVAAGAEKMHFGRGDIHQRSDPLAWKTYRGKNRVTKGGKLFKQDSDYLKNTIKSRYKLSGKSATEEGVAEDQLNELSPELLARYRKAKGAERDLNWKWDPEKEKQRQAHNEPITKKVDRAFYKELEARRKQSGVEDNYRPKQGVAEETEQIDEVSMEELLKYVPNAVADLSNRQIKINTGTSTANDAKKVQNRKKGLSRAAEKIGYKMAPESVAEGEIEDAEEAHKKINTPAAFRKAKGGDWKVTGQDLEKEKARTGTSPEGLSAIKKLAGLEEPVKESKDKTVTIRPENEQELIDWMEGEGFDLPEPTTDNKGNLVYDFTDMNHGAYMYASDFDIGSQEADDDLAENLDANQKRAGQLGPTGRPAEVGDLVGTNESTDPLKDMLRLLGK